MKATILQENLKHALSYVQKAIPSRPPLPILSSVLLEVGKNKATIAATDLYFGVRTNFPIKDGVSGSITIPGKQLRDVVFSLPKGSMNLEKKESSLRIKSSAGSVTLQTQESDEFPPFPQVEGETIELPFEWLVETVGEVVPSASTDQTRPVLTSVLLKFINDELVSVATDGFRLAVKKSQQSNKAQAETSLLVPAKVIAEVKSIAEQQEVEKISCTVSQELKQIFFAIGEVEVFARLIEGEYPPYEQIIPSAFEAEISLDSDALADQVKRAMIFARDSSSIIKLTYSQEKIEVSASSPAIGSFEGIIDDCKVTGEDGAIAFNARYVLDFLQLCPSQNIQIKISGALRPALFSTPENNNLQYVVMPFRMNQE